MRILRILAGEGHGQFSADSHGSSHSSNRCSVPLSVAMDYVGSILDDSSKNIHRLKVSSFSLLIVPLHILCGTLTFSCWVRPLAIIAMKNNVEEYSRLCNDLELEIHSLQSSGDVVYFF